VIAHVDATLAVVMIVIVIAVAIMIMIVIVSAIDHAVAAIPAFVTGAVAMLVFDQASGHQAQGRACD
jgi:xanthine/uracil permease